MYLGPWTGVSFVSPAAALTNCVEEEGHPMPTPTDVFVEIAATYGGVDPEDLMAVQMWYQDDLPQLPEETINEILDRLLTGKALAPMRAHSRSHPENAPLPRLDASPPAGVPFAAEWLAVLRRLPGER